MNVTSMGCDDESNSPHNLLLMLLYAHGSFCPGKHDRSLDAPISNNSIIGE